MKEYIVVGNLVKEDEFFEKVEGLEAKFEKMWEGSPPAVRIQFGGTQRELYELLDYTPAEVTISTNKSYPGPERPWERRLKRPK